MPKIIDAKFTEDDKPKKKGGFFAGLGARLQPKQKPAKTSDEDKLKRLRLQKEKLELKKQIRELTPVEKSKLQRLREYNVKHRARVLARETYRKEKLELRVSQHNIKSLLPQTRKDRIKNINKSYGGPLSDKGGYSGGLGKRISKPRGGPLSDYRPKPKPSLDNSNAAVKRFTGKGGGMI